MIALVSGGSRPMFSENTVMIYDDKKNKFVLEYTLPSPVLGVRLKRNKLVAICRSEASSCTQPERALNHETNFHGGNT
jgi:hypothetical protein